MIALNIVLMTAVVVGIVSLLAWAIVSDRHSNRAAGGELPVAVAPLAQNLEMPHELRTGHRAGRSHAPRTRRPATRSASSTTA
jgi:hypothetical protein